MKIEKAVKLVNKKFIYKADHEKIDNWEVLDINQENIRGDCEDYSLTFIWVAEDQSLVKFILSLLIMKYVIWHCISPYGDGHAITYVRENGMWIDNIQKRFFTREELKEKGYKLWFPWASFLAFPRLIWGKIV